MTGRNKKLRARENLSIAYFPSLEMIIRYQNSVKYITLQQKQA